MPFQGKALALLIAAVAISGALVGYVAATQIPTIAHAFADSTSSSTTTTSSETSSSSYSSINGNWMMNGNYPPPAQGSGPWRQFGGGGFGGIGNWQYSQQVVTIPTGTTITITSTQGQFRVFGNPSENGTASGTLTFTVDSNLSSGYVLTITSGTLTINGTTYTISSGTAQMNLAANGIQGQGTASSNSTFTIRASASGNFSGNVSARTMLDFKSGSTEYAVFLTGTIQG